MSKRAPGSSTDLQPGLIFMTFHFREAAVNLLTSDALDPIAKIPGFKVCAVRVRKVEAYGNVQSDAAIGAGRP